MKSRNSFGRFFKARTTARFLPNITFLNDQEITSAEEKAEAFNSYFISTFRPDLPISQKCSPSTCSQNNLEFISSHQKQLVLSCQAWKPTKQPDPTEYLPDFWQNVQTKSHPH